MFDVHLYTRKSFKYADGWRHLDNDEYLGTIRVTPAVVIREPAPNADMSEGPTYVQYARLPAGIDVASAKQAIRDTMGGSNCRHEYDCCGCSSRSVRVTNVGRKLRIITNVSFNY